MVTTLLKRHKCGRRRNQSYTGNIFKALFEYRSCNTETVGYLCIPYVCKCENLMRWWIFFCKQRQRSQLTSWCEQIITSAFLRSVRDSINNFTSCPSWGYFRTFNFTSIIDETAVDAAEICTSLRRPFSGVSEYDRDAHMHAWQSFSKQTVLQVPTASTDPDQECSGFFIKDKTKRPQCGG